MVIQPALEAFDIYIILYARWKMELIFIYAVENIIQYYNVQYSSRKYNNEEKKKNDIIFNNILCTMYLLLCYRRHRYISQLSRRLTVVRYKTKPPQYLCVVNKLCAVPIVIHK